MQPRHERIQRFEFLVKAQPRPTRSTSSSPQPQHAPADHSTAPDSRFELQWQLQELRRMTREGVPDEPKYIRPATYRRLLDLEPGSDSLAVQYSQFLTEIDARLLALPKPQPHAPLDRHDKLLREIERDVERTFGTLAWFGAKPAREPHEGAGTADQAEHEDEDALWKRIRMLDELDHEIAKELAEKEARRQSVEEPSEPTSSETLQTSTSAIPPPTLTLNIPSSVDTTAVDIPPTPITSAPPSTTPFSIPPPPSDPRPSTRREALLRPLFVYAVLNPGVSYVQGMSYLAAVFNYIFSSESPSPSPLEIEAVTFHALGAFVAQLRDLYSPTFDGIQGDTNGLTATIERFNGLLLWLDPTLAEALDRKRIELGGIILRWSTTAFANEFALPDLVRIWDRIVSVFPREDQPSNESLSPMLSHVLDLALAIVITNRATFISPFSSMQAIYGALQSPAIEGAAVDKLLLLAWDIRERRLGRQPASTTPGSRGIFNTPKTRTSTNSETGVGGARAGLFKQKMWSPKPSRTTAVSDFELESASSVTDSQLARSPHIGHTTTLGSNGADRFGSIAFSSPRSSSGSLANNVTMVEGKLLPPPPARMEEQETIASLVEAELASPEYAVDDDDDDNGSNSIGAGGGGVSALQGWFKTSVSRFAQSDVAANLSKKATNLQLAAAQSATTTASRLNSSDAAAQLMKAQTNLAIQAQLLKDRVAAEQIANRVKEASGRFLASTGSERGQQGHDDSGPRETPFTPPSGFGRMDQPSSPNNAPRPLLLSSAARRAQNGSIDEQYEGSPSAGSSRRSSTTSHRSPSVSPVLSRSMHLPLLSPDMSIPPLSRSPSTSRGAHGRTTSTFDTPSKAPLASMHRPRSASQTYSPSSAAPLVDHDAVTRQGEQAGGIVSGRGWTLSDAPVPSTLANQTSVESEASAEEDDRNGLSGLAIRIPSPLSNEVESVVPEQVSPAAAVQKSHRPPRNSSLATDGASEPRLPSAQPTESAFVPPTSPSETPFEPPSSTEAPNFDLREVHDDDVPLGHPRAEPRSLPVQAQPSLSRGAKVQRRPAATKKRSSRGSLAGSIDLSNPSYPHQQPEERRFVNEELKRSSSNGTTASEREYRAGRRNEQRKEHVGSDSARNSLYDDSILDHYE
ncbi:uncharacterized protein JCM15063_003782 [Sporobolomyces koalae]|uniref:uncharacterized protein n=1 Tax=Sporobolomyces koalae TaxID=500713 RepID=UPI0031810419